MKTTKVYELLIKTNDGEFHNLIFSSRKRADDSLKKHYYIGATVPFGNVINSFIAVRFLH